MSGLAGIAIPVAAGWGLEQAAAVHPWLLAVLGLAVLAVLVAWSKKAAARRSAPRWRVRPATVGVGSWD